MAFVHGKDTIITIDSNDISAYVKTSDLEQTGDSHDVTTYGKDAHVYSGGLKDGKATMEGVYDNSTTSGPKAVIQPLVGTVVTLVRKPEGTGTGKPIDTVDVLVTSYKETSPVADMVSWSCEMQFSDDLVTTTQT